MTTWRSAYNTNVGLVREANEDAVVVTDQVVIVADGMGGHAAGEVASELAVSIFARVIKENRSLAGLNTALHAVNEAILHDAVAHPERAGMGTTLTAVVPVAYEDGSALAWVNIGDSRLYQLRDGVIRQVTEDHSVAEEWVREGRISKEEAAVHPRRHQLTRVLGMEEALDGDTGVLSVRVGDRLLLCSDGLTNEVSDTELVELASAPITLDDAVASLVARACANGGHDNITVALLEVESVSVDVPQIAVTPSGVMAIPARQSTTARSSETVMRRRRRTLPRWITWRTGIFTSALAGLVAAVFVILGWFASASYYLGDNQGLIAVYQGQPNGFLWFHPKEVFVTSFKSAELRPGDARELKKNIAESSLSAAIRHADNMHSAWLATQPVVAP
ncbi:unannotated protein [freshwater metagenome]|uniref:Unannotated protein n=1 Tax=freshwater metagenome TaxID=449393 RepID=A0A6J7DMT8_9ZZZZ|nr:Stp1/IreP family PP2C-type Ser/Thr phosphatase [Actinomycetota bacterium]MUH58344.1 Stp1/IreP family PP2C-type Ser/Thr phosphatase [Actinomycetota bacterium]